MGKCIWFFSYKKLWFSGLHKTYNSQITPKYNIGCKEPSHFRLRWLRAKSLNGFCNLSILVEFFYDFDWLTWLRLLQSFKIIWAKHLLRCNVFQSFICSRQLIKIQKKKKIQKPSIPTNVGPFLFCEDLLPWGRALSTPLSFLDQILSAKFLSENFQTFLEVKKLTSIGLIWHPGKLIESYKKSPRWL